MKKEISQEILSPVIERYELKYQIPFELIDPISEFVSIYCTLDHFSEISHNNFYTVNNLYFDSSDFHFLRNKLEDTPNRFNMRIRSYRGTRKQPVFLEIKNKNIDTVKKIRGMLSCNNWQKLFTDKNYLNKYKNCDEENINNFLLLQETYDARPKVLTQYMRKAYVSNHDDYARVTFDTKLSCYYEENYNLTPDTKKLIPYDSIENFNNNCNVILELKCYTINIPFWMIDLIKTFNLVRSGFSKYAVGMTEVLNELNYCINNSLYLQRNEISL